MNNFREIIHPLLVKAMTSKTTGKLNVEGELPNIDSFLIVANHTSIEDIPTLAQAVVKHFYLLVSDEDKKTIDGLALDANGVVWVHRTSKESRQNANNKIETIILNGKKFAMYPEATWNLSPNNLIMMMNYGCIRIALDTKAPIVPVVTFFTQDKRYTKIGEPFNPSKDLTESINQLRDIMCSLFYEEIEQYYKENYESNKEIKKDNITGEDYFYESREKIEKGYWKKYVDAKYSVYKRANNDKSGVREFESQFIFTPKTDDHDFFQEFNSIIRTENGRTIIKRISSENNGFDGETFGEEGEKNFFGYGYNEKVLQRRLERKE